MWTLSALIPQSALRYGMMMTLGNCIGDLARHFGREVLSDKGACQLGPMPVATTT